MDATISIHRQWLKHWRTHAHTHTRLRYCLGKSKSKTWHGLHHVVELLRVDSDCLAVACRDLCCFQRLAVCCWRARPTFTYSSSSAPPDAGASSFRQGGCTVALGRRRTYCGTASYKAGSNTLQYQTCLQPVSIETTA